MERDDAMLNSKEVARILDLSPDTVNEFARKSILPGFKKGRQWRFRKRDIASFKRQLRGDDSGLSAAGPRSVARASNGVPMPILESTTTPIRASSTTSFRTSTTGLRAYLLSAHRRGDPRANIPAGAKVLEVGVGTGLSLDAYPPHCQVTGVDLAPDMLEHAQEQIDRNGWRHITVMEMDAMDLKFAGQHVRLRHGVSRRQRRARRGALDARSAARLQARRHDRRDQPLPQPQQAAGGARPPAGADHAALGLAHARAATRSSAACRSSSSASTRPRALAVHDRRGAQQQGGAGRRQCRGS